MPVACRSWLRRARSYRIVVDSVPELVRTGRAPEEVERSRPKPLFDSEAMAFVDQVYQRADAFLFGRRTYEVFAGYWG